MSAGPASSGGERRAAHPPGRSAGALRYRAVLDAVWQLRTPASFEERRPTEAGVSYAPPLRRGVPRRYDAYVPTDERTGDSVVLVHGGGFVLGSRTMKPIRFLASRLSDAGVAVCAIDYRMIFRGGRLDEALDDVRCALVRWRDRAERVHGLDPARVSLVGLSAGATLAMLTAARARPGEVHRLVSVFGLYELDHLQGPLATVVPRLLYRTPDRRTWSAQSPRGATQPAVPTLLLHGTADGIVPVDQAHRLAAHREQLGLPTRLVVYPGAPHGFFNTPSTVADQATSEIVEHVRPQR